MKKPITLILAALLVITFSLAGCNNKEDNNIPSLTLCELPESQEEEIGNQIPQWVCDADRALPLNVMTSTDFDIYNDYVRSIFPSYYDYGWTQEQSDKVYLGQGIAMYHLDDAVPENRVVYYPVILNGVVVSGLQVYEDLDSHDLGWQAGPHLANPLNALIQQMAMFDTETTLLLGYNNNTIGIIGTFGGSNVGTIWNNYYILDKLGITKKGNQYTLGKRDLFGLVIAFRYLLPKQDFLEFKRSLISILNRYTKSSYQITKNKLLTMMGFPSDWENITRYQV